MLETREPAKPQQAGAVVPGSVGLHDWSERHALAAEAAEFGEGILGHSDDQLAPQQLREAQEHAPHPLLDVQRRYVERLAGELDQQDLQRGVFLIYANIGPMLHPHLTLPLSQPRRTRSTRR